MEKVLIIRLSSFGDIIQTTACLSKLKERFPQSQIDWLVREDFSCLLEHNPLVHKIYSIPKGGGFSFLWQVFLQLKTIGYTHIYDAHNNTRSNLLLLLWWPWLLLKKCSLIQRPKNRFLRLLLFRFRINRFPWPFVLVKSYLEPLKKWGISKELPPQPNLVLSPHILSEVQKKYPSIKDSSYICLAPSAAWELKRWPVENWQTLIDLWHRENLILLGGPEDHFIQELVLKAKPREGALLNLAGKLNLAESCSLIEKSQLMVGGDSGLTHVADSLGVPCFCIIGAAAFAYPAYPSTHIFDHKLPCKPCSKDGRGRCKNAQYKACLYGISPHQLDQQKSSLFQQASPNSFPQIEK